MSSSLDLPSLLAMLQGWFSNFASNVSNTFSNLGIRDYIRLVWIIGGYLFLRPYLDKGFKKLYEIGASKTEETQRQTEQPVATKMSGNSLRGATASGADAGGRAEDGGQGEEEEDVPQWGKSARRRQQKYMEHLEHEAERVKEEEDDKDIEDLLED